MPKQKTLNLTEWFARYRPHAKQRIFHELCKKHKQVLACAGVRGGKTVAGAQQCAKFIYGDKPEPNLAWLVAPSFKTSAAAAQELLNVFEPCIMHRTGSPGKPMTLYLRPPSGYKYNNFVLDVRTAENPNFLRGVKLAFAWLDEARDQSEDVYNIVLQRLADVDGKLIITTTPRGRSNWLYDRVYARAIAGVKNYGFVQWSTYENPVLDKAVIEELEKDFPRDFGQQELYGAFVNVSGLVYPNFERNKHIVPPFTVPNAFQAKLMGEPAPRLFMAIDFGFNDLFVCLWILDWKNKYWVVHEYAMPRRITREHAAAISNNPMTKYAEVAYCDPNDLRARTELAAAFADYKCGLKLMPAPRDGTGRNRDFDIGIRLVRRLLADDKILTFSTCSNLIKEFGLYHYPDNDDKNSHDKPIDKWNHSVDALRYGLRGWTTFKPNTTVPNSDVAERRWSPLNPAIRNITAEAAEKNKDFEPWYLEG